MPQDLFDFNAVQVVERVCEVFGSGGNKARQDALEQCFHSQCSIRGLADGKLLGGMNDLKEVWASTLLTPPRPANPSRRLFIQIGPGKPTFCVDFYPPKSSPGLALAKGGLGECMVGMVVVCRVEGNVLTHVWVGEDEDGLATKPNVADADIQASRVFVGDVLEILLESYGLDTLSGPTMEIHFHDYTDIPVVG